jgi:trk system potassium uptake protein TrkH
MIINFYRRLLLRVSPQQHLLFGFSTYTIIGWLMLCLPFAQKQQMPFIDHLFTAVSAISTTGLATMSVFDTYTLFGQIVVMLLIQVGGIGYMTLTSFLILSSKSRLPNWHQSILKAEFPLPQGFDVRDFIKAVIIFTLVVEAIGALLFYIAFTAAGVEHNFALWSSIFHSVSSFCTAGFGLYNNSFENFAGNGFLNAIISVLSILGSIGFIVVTDFWQRLSGRTKEVTYTSKIIVGVTALLLAFGTVMLYYFEPTIQQMDQNRLMVSFFQSMSALTTVGFNSIPIAPLSLAALLVINFLMYVGASPSGTGGGMKTTTLTALVAIMWSRMTNSPKVTSLGRVIPKDRLDVATSVFILYAGTIFVATLLLSLTDTFALDKILFEVTSAIGTVGLSTGITGSLTFMGKVIIIFVMFVGRVGLLNIGLAFLARKNHKNKAQHETDLAL